MRLLTENNTPFLMNNIPMDDINLYYNVLDYNDPKNIDYYFVPLIYIETFTAPAAELKIGDYTLMMPLDWNILVGDKHLGEMEIVNIVHLNHGNFEVFCFNPVTGYRPEFLNVKITNIFQEMKWFFPQLKSGSFLTVPLMDRAATKNIETYNGKHISVTDLPCAYFIKELNKNTETINIENLI